ncbi:hypothetical protein PROFUN_14459 [Planoprotostelium fungivorum]|uniref:Uncharacterized protein n=1 Tax=Planoprotostelium fungivorum TaxID=1890364 RepID=A0A2P6MXG0_9EUKA|nr:hypothetical protein PROFUN_14459 [Planoprotostelium fungivorum]
MIADDKTMGCINTPIETAKKDPNELEAQPPRVFRKRSQPRAEPGKR